MKTERTALFLPDSKHEQVSVARFRSEGVARLAKEVRDVNCGEWIGALDDELVAARHAGKQLFRSQRGQWALQSAQVRNLLSHAVAVVPLPAQGQAMTQTIARLTPLAEVQALIAAQVKPVAPTIVEITEAPGCALADDVNAAAHPARAVAIVDGWALRSDETLGSGGYAPAALATVPQRIDAGAPLPPECDCVVPPDAVRMSGSQAEVLAEIAPGEGVLAAGGDHDGAAPIAKAGARLTPMQAAAFAVLGVPNLLVRKPRLALASVRADAMLAAASALILRDAQARGARVETMDSIDAVLNADSDAALVIGGTGTGRKDVSVASLVGVHGIALSPGDTAGFGFVGKRPVLLLPGRLDAAVSVWLMLGRALLDQLCGIQAESERPATLTLARKVSSTVGLTELVPVRRDGVQAVPLASRVWPLSVLARADGYIVIPPESEGSSVGSAVRVWPWP